MVFTLSYIKTISSIFMDSAAAAAAKYKYSQYSSRNQTTEVSPLCMCSFAELPGIIGEGDFP